MKLFRNKDTTAMALIMEGIVYTMVFNLYNPFIQMFAKRMGGNDLHTALLNAAPPLVAIFMLIPCGILIERINKKKQTVLHLLCIVSLFYAAIAFVPIIPHEGKVMAFVVLIGLMNWPGALYLATWQSYFADNFHGSYANRVYALRSRFSALFGLFTVLVTGILLTYIPKSDAERIVLYQIFYGMCFLLTIVQIVFFSRVKSRKVRHSNKFEHGQHDVKPSRTSLKGIFSGMLRNKKYLVFCICGFIFHFTWQMAWPLFFIYNSDYMLLNEFQFGIINVASGAAQFLSLNLWNKLVEKTGSSRMLIFGAAGLSVVPLFYSTLLSFPVLIIMNIATGISLAGFNLTLFLSLLDTLPKEDKTVYISTFNTLTSITGFLAPLAGLRILNMTNIFLAMAITGVLRLFASLLYFLRWRKGKTVRTEGSQSEEVSILTE